MTALRNFVNGQFTDAASGAVSEVVDPSTGEAYATAPVSGPADVDAALRAAAAAFETWRDTTPAERSLALLKFADAIEARADELVEAESRNTGKPIAMTRDRRGAAARRRAALLRRRRARARGPVGR